MTKRYRDEAGQISLTITPRTEESALVLVERELETIFGISGKKVVLEFTRRYQVSMRDAIRRPGDFQMALYDLLGELGSSLVMARINKRVSQVLRGPAPLA